IRECALAWAVGICTPAEIDALNILQASMLAMRRAVEALAIVPEFVRVDGNRCPELRVPSEAIIGGDDSVPCISAVSIIAKVHRDAEMQRLHAEFPQYGFDRHKGYPTPEHLAALEQHGPSPVHRRSYAPVQRALERATACTAPSAIRACTPKTRSSALSYASSGLFLRGPRRAARRVRYPTDAPSSRLW